MKRMKRIHIRIKKYDDEKRIENNQEVSSKEKNFTILNRMRRNSIHSCQKIALTLFFFDISHLFLFILIIILALFLIFQFFHYHLQFYQNLS